MNTEYLKEFVVLAETRNFWEASARLYMNQSTLSKHIKALEAELGVELFHRTTRHVSLTNYGRAFLPHAQSITRAEFEASTAIQRLKNIENGLLTIGSIPSMPQYHIAQFLAEFRQQYPEAAIRITEDDPNQLPDYLINETCELIFYREDKSSFENNFLKKTQIERIPYMTDHMVALMQRTHPLADRESISLQQLKDEQFCFIKEGSLMYQMAMDACSQAGFVPDIVYTSHRIESIVDMVINQGCIGLLMDQHMPTSDRDMNHEQMLWTTVPIAPAITSQISLCYRTDRPLSKTAQQFVDFCTSRIFK